jgi:hypothetical protein
MFKWLASEGDIGVAACAGPPLSSLAFLALAGLLFVLRGVSGRYGFCSSGEFVAFLSGSAAN